MCAYEGMHIEYPTMSHITKALDLKLLERKFDGKYKKITGKVSGRVSVLILPNGKTYKFSLAGHYAAAKWYFDIADGHDGIRRFLGAGLVRATLYLPYMTIVYKQPLTYEQRKALRHLVVVRAYVAEDIEIEGGSPDAKNVVWEISKSDVEKAYNSKFSALVQDWYELRYRKVHRVYDGNGVVFPDGTILGLRNDSHRSVLERVEKDLDMQAPSGNLPRDVGMIDVRSYGSAMTVYIYETLTNGQRSALKDLVKFSGDLGADDVKVRWSRGQDDERLARYLVKSKDADKFWKQIGYGRAWYAPYYHERNWQKIPLRGRKVLSREMNSQQDYQNKKPPMDKTSQREWRGFNSRRAHGKRRGNVEGHYTEEQASKIRGLRWGNRRIPKRESKERFDTMPAIRTEYARGMEMMGKSKDVKKGKILSAVIFGLVAGAGGFVAGQIVRKKLMSYGLSSDATTEAIRRAKESAYTLHDRRLRLVSKGNNITYIIDNDSVTVAQILKMGDVVTYDGMEGTVISSGIDVTKLNVDAKEVLAFNRNIMKSDEIIYTEKSGMTTWDRLQVDERWQIVDKCNLPESHTMKTWNEFGKAIQDVIRLNYGDDAVKKATLQKMARPKDEDKAEVTSETSGYHNPVHSKREDMINDYGMKRVVGKMSCSNCNKMHDVITEKCDACGNIMKRKERLDTSKIAEEANEQITDMSKTESPYLTKMIDAEKAKRNK